MNPPPKKSNSLITIDILRAVAALGVLFYHQHVGGLLAQYTKIMLFVKIDIFGAKYAVPLFFLISGYCIHLSNIKYLKAHESLPLKNYYIKRFLRIYPPYIFALAVAIAINSTLNTNGFPPMSDLLIHVFALQGFVDSSFNSINVVLWTISIELAFYLIYPIFYYVRLKYSLSRALLLAFVVSCISIIGFAIKTDVYTSAQKYFVLNLWFAWCCGAYLADKWTLNNTALAKPAFKLAYAFIAIVFVLSLYINYPPFDIVFYQFNILIWTGPLVFLISRENWFADHQWLVIRVIGYIGLSSYSLYLLHEPLLYLKNFLVHRYIPFRFQFIFVCIGFALIPFVAWLNYLAIEKPFMKLKGWQGFRFAQFTNK